MTDDEQDDRIEALAAWGLAIFAIVLALAIIVDRYLPLEAQ